MVLPSLPIKLQGLKRVCSIDKEFLNNITSDQGTYFIEEKGQQWACIQGIHWSNPILYNPKTALLIA